MSDDDNVAPTGQTADRQLSLKKKLAFALFATVGFFLCIEVTLRLLGIAAPDPADDPFVGFADSYPLMVVTTDAAGERNVSTASNKLTWFNWQAFPESKPPGSKRIFCVGGSTTYGRPYDDTTSYSGWLREMLPIADDRYDWEVVNAGGVSYASYRVASVIDELAAYQPDLFIVYSAHNEFLERRTYAGMFETSDFQYRIRSALMKTRTWSAIDHLVDRAKPPRQGDSKQTLTAEVDEILNHSVGPVQYHRDPQWRSDVIQHYEVNLRRIVAIARDAGSAVMFIIPAANEKDCSPFKSEFAAATTSRGVERVRLALDSASQMADRGDFQRAMERCRAALAIDDRYAETHFRMGQLLFQSGRYEAAQREFQQAIEEDVCPLRAVTGIQAALRRVASELDVPVVEFDRRLRERSLHEQGHACLGDEYFLDHVHPTVHGHGMLARWILESMHESGFTRVGTLDPSDLLTVQATIDGRLDQQAMGIAMRNLAKVLHWSGKFAEALPRARAAKALLGKDAESQFILADCLVQLGDRRQAVDEYDRLLADTDYRRAYLPFGELLAERGDFDRAAYYLALAALHLRGTPRESRAKFSLGYVQLELSEFESAATSLSDADQGYPNDPTTLWFLAEAQAGAGQTDQAVITYQRLIELGHRPDQANDRIGLLMLQTGKVDAAVERFEAALAANPDNRQAATNLQVAKSVKASREKNANGD